MPYILHAADPPHMIPSFFKDLFEQSTMLFLMGALYLTVFQVLDFFIVDLNCLLCGPHNSPRRQQMSVWKMMSKRLQFCQEWTTLHQGR